MRSRLFSTLKRPPAEGPAFSEFLTKASHPKQEPILPPSRLPEWLRTPIAVGEKYSSLKDTLRGLKLHTVIVPILILILKFSGL